jgi:hypothetical protein
MDIKALAQESVWIEKYRYNDAERDYYQNLNNTNVCDKKVKVRNYSLINYFFISFTFKLIIP